MADLGIAGIGDATLIASGGSALVYRAATPDGAAVAVKVLRGMRGTEVARRFEREIRAAELLRGHSGIIDILGSGTTPSGEPYLIMPLLERGSLADELDRDGPFPLRRAVADVRMAADAVWFAHSNGVLHRDIKPGNLLRTGNDSIVVTDFGIARVTDAGISSATIGASTPLYAAPELLAENDASVRSEVYSLGALLYALLAGAPAFSDSPNLWATISRIRSEELPPIDGVPAPVMAVIAQAMAKDPKDRPSDAGLFSAFLGEALGADPGWRPPRPAPATQTFGAPQASSAGVSGPGPGVESVPAIVAELPASPAAPDQSADAPPAAPSFDRPARPIDKPTRPRSRRGGAILATLAAIALLGGLALLAIDRLSGSDPDLDSVETVDTSLPSPGDATAPTDTDGNPDGAPEPASNDGAEADVEPDDDQPDDPEDTGTGLVTFTGDWYRADLPTGWSLVSADRDVGYGYRSEFFTEGSYLIIDTTPSEQRGPRTDMAEGAREIAAGIRTASAVRSETIDGVEMHSFTFINNDGVDSIDVFFEHDGNGYAVLAGSSTDPQNIFLVAKQVAASVRSR